MHVFNHLLPLALTVTALAGCGGFVPSTAGNTLPAPAAALVARTGSRTVAPFAYVNQESSQWNLCGQAAAATLLDHAGLNPLHLGLTTFSPLDHRWHPDNDAFVGGLAKAYPPDIALGLAGTSPQRLSDMLAGGGMKPHVSSGPAGDYDGLAGWVRAGWPVAVLVDGGVLWNKPLVYHWAVVFALNQAYVDVANPMVGSGRIPLDSFNRAWATVNCPFHYAQVAAER